MDSMFCLLWQWNPSENTANCTLTYERKLFLRNGQIMLTQGKGSYFVADDVERIDINKEIVFEVHAECNNTNITSTSTSLATHLAAGNPNTSVRNLTCVWHYSDYVNCTWQPGQDATPNVNYSLLYWTRETTDSCAYKYLREFKMLPNLVDTGRLCQEYTSSDGIPNGCQFRFKKTYNTFDNLVIAVSDWSKQVRPYFLNVKANDIAKLKPPVITAYRTPNRSINIAWNDLDVHEGFLYHVQLEMSNSQETENFEVVTVTSKEIPSALPDVTYIVRVRVRLPKHAAGLNGREALWSDWSDKIILQGEDNGRTLSVLLLILIPGVIIVSAVILLIYMRRLRILIFPKIPDPGRVISTDLQQWIKNGRTVYNEPKKEEICPVSLLETPLTLTHVD
ncbi:interleukin-13 receptor subunit alpha-1-like isoform X2 [Hyperolius riggenbachi]